MVITIIFRRAFVADPVNAMLLDYFSRYQVLVLTHFWPMFPFYTP